MSARKGGEADSAPEASSLTLLFLELNFASNRSSPFPVHHVADDMSTTQRPRLL